MKRALTLDPLVGLGKLIEEQIEGHSSRCWQSIEFPPQSKNVLGALRHYKTESCPMASDRVANLRALEHHAYAGSVTLTAPKSKVLRTAARHPRTRRCRASSFMRGIKLRSLFHFLETPSASGQTSAPYPASHAAPSAVVSVTTGRSTGTFMRSASRCIVQSLAAMPPSTRKTVSPLRCQSSRIAVSKSQV